MKSNFASYMLTFSPYCIVAGCLGLSLSFFAITDYNREKNKIEPRHSVHTNPGDDFGENMEVIFLALMPPHPKAKADRELSRHVHLYSNTCPEMQYLNELMRKSIEKYTDDNYNHENRSLARHKSDREHHDLAKQLVRRAVLRQGYIRKYLKFLFVDKFCKITGTMILGLIAGYYLR